MSDATEKPMQPAKALTANVEVKLLKNHTHAGIDYVPGDTIEITQAQADRLKAQGVI
jgi:hypothetical protein